MNIEQRLQSARRALVGYQVRLTAFENGHAIPQIGEKLGTERLLRRAERRLRAMEIMRVTLPKNVKTAHC